MKMLTMKQGRDIDFDGVHDNHVDPGIFLN